MNWKQVETFGKRLNDALKARNMRPVDLANDIGVSEATISNYRRGYCAVKPCSQRFVDIVNALKVSPEWLLGLNVDMDYGNYFE